MLEGRLCQGHLTTPKTQYAAFERVTSVGDIWIRGLKKYIELRVKFRLHFAG